MMGNSKVPKRKAVLPPQAACQLCLLWVGCHSDATRETGWSLLGKLGSGRGRLLFGGATGGRGGRQPLTHGTGVGCSTHQLLNVHQTVHEGLAPLM